MEKTKVMFNGVELEVDVVSAKAEIFIIPNTIGKLDPNEAWDADKISQIQSIADVNESYTFVPAEDNLIQLWWICKDGDSENLGDHGANFEGRFFDCRSTKIVGMLPTKWFAGLDDGDSMDINVLFTDEDKKMLVRFTVTANQADHRYGRLGSFHYVLSRVGGSY